MANKAAGKGYENENFYSDIKFQFLGIENIHVMRNSLQKLIDGELDVYHKSLKFSYTQNVCCNHANIQTKRSFLREIRQKVQIGVVVSSPEPKAQGELIVYRSSRRLSVCLSVCGHFQT